MGRHLDTCVCLTVIYHCYIYNPEFDYLALYAI
jgi:hypothetical protein